jgi:hypothetical protein
MKLQLESTTPKEKVLTLKVVQGDNTITISDKEAGWDIITLRVENEKLVLVKWQGIDDVNYNTDKDGRIVEVEE